ncbi:hypothetical protein N752_26895 [Desulforamulus aquiferis]|nr:2Fe-2S iron-sulfur cluster-binding protein [Desulforamulus aquiferis]RYD02081.1 hypothetical protein N752_26895 [Desulforamulus aquiferis]
MKSNKKRITFLPEGHMVEVVGDTTLLEAARIAGVELVAPCGGTERCGRCGVRVTIPGQEGATFSLACQTVVINGMKVYLEDEVNTQPSSTKQYSKAAAHLGMAIDLGTTTLAGYLHDLTDGSCLSSHSALNGQVAFGTDVITRMAYGARSQEHYQRLTLAAINSIEKLIQKCCSEAKVSPDSICEIVIVGNTPMIHLLLKWPIASLKESPFQPYAMGPTYIKGKELAIQIAPQLYAIFRHLLEVLSGQMHLLLQLPVIWQTPRIKHC